MKTLDDRQDNDQLLLKKEELLKNKTGSTNKL